MKEDFLTIPAAPNYEINSEFICRNKKNGYILKLNFTKEQSPYYQMYNFEHVRYCLSPQSLRRLAEAAVENDSFLPVHSLNCRYEINTQGVVRNARTKKIIKPKPLSNTVLVSAGQPKTVQCSIADLLWEVHGIYQKCRKRPCPCFAENSAGKHYFENLAECAQFIAPKIFYSVGRIRQLLHARTPEFFGWKITYCEPQPDIKWDRQGLGLEAARIKRLDKAAGL